MNDQYKAVVGKDISDDAADLISDYLIKNKSQSIRQLYREFKRELQGAPALNTVLGACHQYNSVTELTQPMVQRFIERALQVREQQTEAA